jgi:hypothetical protein
MDYNDELRGDKMSNPKYPDIKVSTHHKSTDPMAVLMAVSHAMKEAGVPTSDAIEYLDNVLGIIQNSETNAKRAVAVVKESLKWVALTD